MANPMQFDEQVVLANVRRASTEDLLNRVTAFRGGMEPEAVRIIEAELRGRGIEAADIAAHAEKVQVIRMPDGAAACCTYCRQPAIACGSGWYRLWGKVPLFPRWQYYCAKHKPA
jgi:hypothetical protein